MSKDIDCDVYSWVMRATGESREELDTAADDERTTVAWQWSLVDVECRDKRRNEWNEMNEKCNDLKCVQKPT